MGEPCPSSRVEFVQLKRDVLAQLRDECPEDLQPAIFDKDWPLTIWYRIDEFQLVSLKIIAEAPPATASRSAGLSTSRPTPLEPP